MMIMGSRSIDVKTSLDDTFPKVQRAIGNSEYKIKTIVPNQMIMAEGGREFRWLWMIIMILLIWPAALVYYFTRQRSSVTVVTSKTDDGCKVTITSTGKTGDVVLESIANIL
jgi:hypothetical protein